ncbi:hypothetical protein BURK2_03936 [Burkholderiales bacterium]|nr:hypothetical protein BURK2_03936 [Burkholderiales bacterium]
MRSLQLVRPALRRGMAELLMGSLAIGLVVAASAAPPRPDTLRCDADGAMAGKGTWESQLGLTVTGSLPERLEYSGLEEGEGGAKTCEFEVARKDGTTRWETQGQRTRIWRAGNANADAPDLDLILRGKEFEAKFGPGLAALCEAGLALPQRMTRLANAKCKVER